MQKIFSSLIAIFLFVTLAIPTSAQNVAQQDKNTSKTEVIYMFGVSQSLKDSLVYISEISEVVNAPLDKQGFLIGRQQYAQQFRQYVEVGYQRPNQTAAVFFSKNLKSLNKSINKTIKRFEGKMLGGMKQKVVYVPKDQFVFHRVSTP